MQIFNSIFLDGQKIKSNLEAMQKFLIYFKCVKLSEQIIINQTYNNVILFWKKVADGSLSGCLLLSLD